MNEQPSSDFDSNSSKPRKAFSYGLGTLFLLTALFAVAAGWLIDRYTKNKGSYDVIGPLTIEYEYRRNPNSTPSQTINGALGIKFEPGIIIVETANGGLVIPTETLIEFEWSPE